MKVIIFSTHYKRGGAELQAIFERNILNRKNIQTLYVTFDPDLDNGYSCEEGHINLEGKYKTIKRRLLNLFVDPILYLKVTKLLKSEKPDLVHFHNITYGFITLAMAARKFKTIQTMHDYAYVCDKSMKCITNEYRVCESCSYSNCKRQCFDSGIKGRLLLLYKWNVRKLNRYIRNRNIDFIISPSKKLSDYLNDNGYKSVVVNNPLDLDEFTHQKCLTQKKKVLMYGSLREDKGIYQLLDAFRVTDYHNIELELIGPKGKDLDDRRFEYLLKKSGANYLGVYNHKEITRKLAEVYAVIIPSLWMENYPNTALEGMLTDCIVCGSDRGGIPEMVVSRNLLFDVLDPEDIKRCLRYLDCMSEYERIQLCNIQKAKILENNTPEAYLGKLADITGIDL